MRKLLVILATLLISFYAIGQDSNSAQLKLHDYHEFTTNDLFLGNRFIKNWPKDKDGEQDCALIRLSLENIPSAQAADIKFQASTNSSVEKISYDFLEDYNEIHIFVSPSTASVSIEARLDLYGWSNRISCAGLEPKHVYGLTLTNAKTLPVTVSVQYIENMSSDIVVVMDNDYALKKKSPANFQNISLGRHNFKISRNSILLKDTTVEVSETNTNFFLDLRPKKKIVFKSEPQGAEIFINGKNSGRTPCVVELPYDTYHVTARLSVEEVDEANLYVNEHSSQEIILEPIKQKEFLVFATYNGKKVNAYLYIDNELYKDSHYEGSQPSYTLKKPIGKSYAMKMDYMGNTKDRKIKVTQDMDVEQEFKISARNSFVWPWQRDYDSRPIGLSFAYVAKQLVTNGNGEKLIESGVWDDGEGKYLHGMQFGLHFQPCFSFGLGLYTGLFYEFYLSDNNSYDYNKFREHCAYIPIHAYYRLPFSYKIALSVHGGLGFNYSIYGAYSNSDGNYEDYTDFYGKEAFPKRFNMAAEVGLGLRLGVIQLNAQYAKGLTDHKSYSSLGDYKTTQNKYSLGISFVF